MNAQPWWIVPVNVWKNPIPIWTKSAIVYGIQYPPYIPSTSEIPTGTNVPSIALMDPVQNVPLSWPGYSIKFALLAILGNEFPSGRYQKSEGMLTNYIYRAIAMKCSGQLWWPNLRRNLARLDRSVFCHFVNSLYIIFRPHQLGIGAAAALVQRINGDSFSSIKNMKNWPSTSIHSERAKIIQNDRSFPFVPIF